MKKAKNTILLALALILIVAALSACGISNNPKATKEALEEKGYSVDAVIGDNDLDAQANLDSMSDEMHITAGDLVAMISATKGELQNDTPEDFIYIYYFKDGKVANTFWDANKEDLDGIKEQYKTSDGFEVKKCGSVVYFGTKQAIQAAM